MSLIRGLRHRSVIAYFLVAAMGAVAPSGCGYGCDDYLAPSFTIEVLDARTRQPTAAGATISITGRDFADSVRYDTAASENTKRYVVYESEAEAGLYVIVVRKEGYETWTRPVQLTGDKCHVRPMAIDVELEPLEG